MLGSITPLGERGRGRSWGRTITAYLIGSAAGAAGLGALLGLVGQQLVPGAVSPSLVAWILGGLVMVGLLLDLRAFGARLPTVHRQVNEEWLSRYRGWVYGLGFGFQLGFGVVTVVTTSAVYVTFLTALLSGSPASGSLIGLAFGALRGAAILVVAGVRRPEQLARVHDRLARWDPLSRRSGLLAQAALALAVIAMAVR